jgi:hypothetical protein
MFHRARKEKIMAQSIEHQTLEGSHVLARSHPELWKFRLALGWAILFAAMVGLFALSWDIQWHTAVGRDRTLTAPHLFILGSIAVMGLAALFAVLSETIWARRSPEVARSGTIFAGFFSSSLGVYLVGYGALTTAVSFPLDQYWHTLYGIDVTVWAPFHIMLLTGFCISSLGMAEMLVAGARLASQQGARRAARAGYMGGVISLATLMGFLSILLPNALDDEAFVTLGSLAFTVFPLMLSAFGMFVLIIAIRALSWPGMATCVAVVYILFGLINFPLIPPLMVWLLGIEQQSLRQQAPTIAILGVRWQYGLFIAAVFLDIMAWIARRRGWSLKKLARLTPGAGMVGMSLATLAFPGFLDAAQEVGEPMTMTIIKGQATVPEPIYNFVVVVAISLLLGLLGVYIGSWFGTSISNVIREKGQS